MREFIKLTPDTARRYVMNLFNLNENQIIVYGANGKLPEEKRLDIK